MTAWIYVLALYHTKDKTIRFEHTVVMARDEVQAYRRGAKKAKKAGILPAHRHETGNDYVIRLVPE